MHKQWTPGESIIQRKPDAATPTPPPTHAPSARTALLYHISCEDLLRTAYHGLGLSVHIISTNNVGDAEHALQTGVDLVIAAINPEEPHAVSDIGNIARRGRETTGIYVGKKTPADTNFHYALERPDQLPAVLRRIEGRQ